MESYLRMPQEPCLFQKNNRGKNGDCQDEHEPLKIVAFEPAGKVQHQNNDRNGIKCVKHDAPFSPADFHRTKVATRNKTLIGLMIMIHESKPENQMDFIQCEVVSQAVFRIPAPRRALGTGFGSGRMAQAIKTAYFGVSSLVNGSHS